MSESSISIANIFIEKAKNKQNFNLTPMKLQKLMFFAQSWYLKSHNVLLFDGYFERWQYGPVLPDIYHEFKSFGSREIDIFGKVSEFDRYKSLSHINKQEYDQFLNKIIEVYGNYSGSELSWMTHQPNTAWSRGQLGTLISMEDMIMGEV